MQQININRNYKDRLFRLAFQEKEDLLDLYNAVSGRQYTNPEDIIITTLADAIYLGMKNDISFLVSDVLNLYEHQSSFNPNMPVRGLNYFADTYREYIEINGLDIYGEKLIRLPMPQYIVFYNGMKEEPDRVELRLSDAFLCQNPEENGCLECRATMININYGHNEELMDRCKRLKDYAVFVNRIRENERRGMALNEAVELAVNSCINEGILADILKKNRAEVCNLILYEYDEQKQLAIAREGAKKAGREEGMTTPFAKAKRINIFSACSGFLTSENDPQVFITPTTKNKTNRARPMAISAPLICSITCQMPPPLKSLGDWVMMLHISANFSFHVFKAFCRF